MNIVYMGTPDYASSILQTLIEDEEINVLCVFTQPDKPVGRKKILTSPPVKSLAHEHGIEVHQPQNLRGEETHVQIKVLRPDFIVVAAYGQILPKVILDIAPCINLHASILPHYRGASPIQQAILNGDKETGVTAMLMDVGLDTGDILKIARVEIPGMMMVEELFELLTDVAAELSADVLKNFTSLKPQKQDDARASHCSKITKEKGLVSFDDARTLYNTYRAYTPWPGVYLRSGLKLKKMSLESTEGEYLSGEILEISKESALIGCKKGAVRLYSVQPASKNEMAVQAYLNGKRLQCADILV
ncbi:MAG: methionyl-tRNA formyltransferase [Campylobacterales bacterium]|nr:methionyl-tRNA formyltransferase [Campylobacterales bacterium]